MTPHPEYEDDDGREFTKLLGAWCVLALFCIASWAGIVALIAWAFGI